MNYAAIKNYDIANGPGCRVSFFVSGCRRHCEGCFNQDAQSFDYGNKYMTETRLKLLSMLGDEHIAGLSILGGDPFEAENREEVLKLCKAAKTVYPKKDVWVWTGYFWEDLNNLPVFEYIDVLVDGPFVQKFKDLGLAYRGSENQRVIDVKESLKKGFAVRLKGDWR